MASPEGARRRKGVFPPGTRDLKGMGTDYREPERGAPLGHLPDAVVFVTSVSRGILGGILQYVDPLERLLPRHGIKTVTIHFPRTLNLMESRGLPRFARAPLHVLFAAYCLSRVLRLRRDRRLVLVHGHGASYALLAAFLAGVMGHPTAHTFHSTVRRKSLVARAFARKLDALVFASESLHEQMRALSGVEGRQVHYIPGAVDTTTFAPAAPSEKARMRSEYLAKFGLRDRDPLVVFVGRVVPEKGVLELVEAVGLLKSRGIETSALIAGPVLDSPAIQAYHRTIQERMRSLGIRDRVVLAGPLAHPEIRRLLSAADIFVCASLADAYPISVVEALSSGLPVVASRVGGLVRQVRDGETGIIVEPGNPAELASAIDRLARSDSLRLEMGARARREALLQFGEEPFLRRHLELYASVLRARGMD